MCFAWNKRYTTIFNNWITNIHELNLFSNMVLRWCVNLTENLREFDSWSPGIGFGASMEAAFQFEIFVIPCSDGRNHERNVLREESACVSVFFWEDNLETWNPGRKLVRKKNGKGRVIQLIYVDSSFEKWLNLGANLWQLYNCRLICLIAIGVSSFWFAAIWCFLFLYIIYCRV